MHLPSETSSHTKSASQDWTGQMTIQDMLEQIRARLREKGLNDAVMLTSQPYAESAWGAEACNTNWAVRIGEVEGEYLGYGAAPEEAVKALYDVVMAL